MATAPHQLVEQQVRGQALPLWVLVPYKAVVVYHELAVILYGDVYIVPGIDGGAHVLYCAREAVQAAGTTSQQVTLQLLGYGRAH